MDFLFNTQSAVSNNNQTGKSTGKSVAESQKGESTASDSAFYTQYSRLISSNHSEQTVAVDVINAQSQSDVSQMEASIAFTAPEMLETDLVDEAASFIEGEQEKLDDPDSIDHSENDIADDKVASDLNGTDLEAMWVRDDEPRSGDRPSWNIQLIQDEDLKHTSEPTISANAHEATTTFIHNTLDDNVDVSRSNVNTGLNSSVQAMQHSAVNDRMTQLPHLSKVTGAQQGNDQRATQLSQQHTMLAGSDIKLEHSTLGQSLLSTAGEEAESNTEQREAEVVSIRSLAPSEEFRSFGRFDTVLTDVEGRSSTPIVRSHSIVQDLQNILRFNLIQGNTGQFNQLKVKIHPQHLGEIDIQLSTQEGKVTVQLLASTRMALDMLDRHLYQLQASLIQQGIQVDKIEVSQPSTANDISQGDEKAEQHTDSDEKYRGDEEHRQQQSEQRHDEDDLMTTAYHLPNHTNNGHSHYITYGRMETTQVDYTV